MDKELNIIRRVIKLEDCKQLLALDRGEYRKRRLKNINNKAIRLFRHRG